jgi:D-glycero-alpha-D-manno-heptose-7-phosphate kinase
MKLEIFQISENASLREALEKINKNKHGLILAVNKSRAVIGLATDGDIREKILQGFTLEDPIKSCMNTNFLWADENASRELLLKQLDTSIRSIPILDSRKKLVGLINKDHLPIQGQEKIYARSRAPVRISFGGGGSDLTHYFFETTGAVINTTISLYTHATLRVREDSHIFVYSQDLKSEINGENLQDFLQKDGSFGLIQSIVRTIHPEFGFDLYLHSDYPMNSGLGGSAVVAAAILGCFNQLRQDKWDLHELAELAFQAERLYLGVAGGWQDQYATVFGGFNFMEFSMDQNIVHPLRIHPDILVELEESLLLCDTGTTHDSGNIQQHQIKKLANAETRKNVEANVEISYQMRNELLRGQLLQFGQSLDQVWQYKRSISEMVSSRKLDEVYQGARKHGAIGGKLLGAGGGGFFLFYVPPFRKYELIDYLDDKELKVRPFRFDPVGLRAWSVREARNHMVTTES